jgi:nicotinic acid mononucleotide adenylyltransferase
MERLNLDREYSSIPCRSPATSSTAPPASAAVRYERGSPQRVQDEPRLSVKTRSCIAPGPSCSIDTVEQMRDQHAARALRTVKRVHDNVAELHTWRASRSCCALVQFVVFAG